VTVRWKGLVLTPQRVAQVSVILVLLLLGAVLPYLTMEYQNAASELVRERLRLLAAGDLLGGLDPTYLPVSGRVPRDELTLALNVFGAAPSMQTVGSAVAAATCWGLFYDEINKFFWWPLHLSSYLLILVPIPLFIGLDLMRSAGVVVSVSFGWLPGVLAGIVVLAVTLAARRRIDTYGGV
jgi:hypothetical protein